MGLRSGIPDPGGQTGTTGIPGVKQAPDPGSWIRIRNTGFQPGQAKRRSASKFYIKNVFGCAYFPANGPYFGRMGPAINTFGTGILKKTL